MWDYCYSTAVYVFKMTADEFFNLTPRQFFLLEARHKEQIQHTELLTGIITANLINYSMGAPETPRQVKDFMPSLWKPDPPISKQKKPVDQDLIDAQNRAVFARFVPELNGNQS